MYCTAPLSPRKGRLISFHDDDDDDEGNFYLKCPFGDMSGESVGELNYPVGKFVGTVRVELD